MSSKFNQYLADTMVQKAFPVRGISYPGRYMEDGVTQTDMLTLPSVDSVVEDVQKQFNSLKDKYPHNADGILRSFSYKMDNQSVPNDPAYQKLIQDIKTALEKAKLIISY